MKRIEFRDKQKAEIYQRDKGLCAFSGKILWILHGGASKIRDTDWVDHIKPAMKGGDNSIENGICASSFFNSKKKDNSHDNKFLFHNGKATKYFYLANGYIPTELNTYLHNIKLLKNSDWYFNRALQNLLIVVEHIISPYDLKGNLMIRDGEYWGKAALKKINEWKKISNNENIEDFTSRLNIDINSLGNDQKIMLSIIKAQNLQDILSLSEKLVPYYKNSIKYFTKLETNISKDDIKELLIEIKNENFISNRDKNILIHSLNYPIVSINE